MQKKQEKKSVKYVSGFMGLAVLTTLAVAVPALAATTTPPANAPAWGNRMMGGVSRGAIKPGVFGTVSAVSGNTITVTSTPRMMDPKSTSGTPATTPTTTTYTVNATSATVTKNNVAGSISSIAVGDTITAQGTLTGTNLVATTIRDGVMTRTPGVAGVSVGKNQPSLITGNGQPVVAGTVLSVSGNTLTITNKSNVTYTIDVANAKIVEGQNTITISGVAVGDSVVVQGTVSGNSIAASSVIDQKAPSTATPTTTKSKGFFGSIGSFFSHLFGF